MNNNLVRHILQWIFVFAAALASVFTLQSCGLKEPFPGPQSGISEGTVEFVARPAGYNNHDVTTKADGNPSTFEDDEIHNAFLLVFNQDGQRLLCEEIRLNAEDGGLSAKVDRSMGNVTACVLANVPASFAKGIIGTTNPGSASGNQYLNTAVLDLTYDSSKSGILGVPVLDLDNDKATASVPCIPMYGQTDRQIDLSNNNSIIQISLTRLFAKISVNLGLSVDLDNWAADMVNNASYFQLNNYQVNNIPTKVKLLKDEIQSEWYNSDSFDNVTSGDLKTKVYNKNTTSFQFYVPEYYLDALKEDEYYNLPDRPEGSYGNAKFKPLHYGEGLPIYIFMTGSYSQFSYNTTNLQYKIFLGRNEHSDFSLERNVNYINDITIKGISNNDKGTGETLDHRVTTEVINNPVAVAGQSANCYIIGQKGDYSFPAYKGAYNDLKNGVLCTGNKKSIVVDLTEGNHNNIKLSDLSYDPDKNMISFKITEIADGNVVIALKNEDDSIEWSWHLWCNTQSGWEGMLNTDWGELKTQTYPNSKLWADRNLGASVSSSSLAEGIGLYYQYGNKNPFISNGYKGGGTNGSQTWAKYDKNGKSLKSINDPCPPGYKVPTIDAWSSSTSLMHTTLDATGWLSNGVLRIYDQTGTDNDVYYPYSGHRFDDKSDPSITSYADQDFEVKDQFTGSVVIATATFRNVKFKARVTIDTGCFLSIDEKSNPRLLTYGYYNVSIADLANNFELISCDYKPSFSSWKNNQTKLSSTYLSALKAGLLLNNNKRSGYIFDTESAPMSPEYGYQIRCIRETE